MSPSSAVQTVVPGPSASRINVARVLLGGLLGGLIILVVDMLVNGALFGREWQSALTSMGHPPATTGLVYLVVWALLAGICDVWLYAAARPRFGPGPKTAVITGFAFWIFSYGLPTIGLISFGFFPVSLPLISAAGGLAESILAALAGGRVYKE